MANWFDRIFGLPTSDAQVTSDRIQNIVNEGQTHSEPVHLSPGDLVKGLGDEIYIIALDLTRRWIPNPETLAAITQYIDRSVLLIPQSELDAIPQGPDWPDVDQDFGAFIEALGDFLAPQPSTGGALLGIDAGTSEPVFLDDQARRQGLYIIGRNGTGKSTMLLNLIDHDMEAGHGLCVLDPHGDLIEACQDRIPIHRMKDVILLDPTDYEHPFGLNLFQCADPYHPILSARSCSRVMQIFQKLWGVGPQTPRLMDLLRHATLTLMENPGCSMADLPMLLENETFRARLTAGLGNRQVRNFWRQSYDPLSPREQLEHRESTLNKVREFLSQPLIRHIVGQSQTTIDFRQAVNTGKIVLVPLPVGIIGEDLSSLIGCTIVGQVLEAALSRAELPFEQRLPFHLFADEYHRFAISDFAVFLAEARKYGVATTIAHQFRAQLDQGNRGATSNAGNIVVFRATAEDGPELAAEFDSTPPPPGIIGQEPILTVCHQPYEYLLRTSHLNPRVNEIFNKHLRKIHSEVAAYSHSPSFTETGNILRAGLNPKNYETATLSTDLMAQKKIDAIDVFIFESMMENIDYKLLIDVLKQLKKDHIDIYFSDYFDLLMAQKFEEVKRDFQEKVNIHHNMDGKLIIDALCSDFDFACSLVEIAILLRTEPIFINSGQFQPTYDRPRPYADVQNEIATRLVNLPNYHAQCKLLQGGRPIEHVIKTTAAAPPIWEGDQRAMIRAVIRDRSRRQYATSLADVEAELEAKWQEIDPPQRRRTVKE